MSNLVTDKELLAICNLSNLKMEFADVAKTRDQQTNEILSNHTIYSLLAKEREAILNKDKDTTVKKEHVFVRKETSSYGEEPKSKIIYEDIINFKKEAGLVYEYFEKYSLGNSQGKFTEEWEILDSFDGYELLKRYYDIQKELSHQGLYYDNELGQRIFLYEISSEKKNQILQKEKDNLKNKDKKINNQENKERYSYLRKAIFDKERKYVEVSNLEVTEEEGKMYEEYYSDIDSIKLYPTREEIERKIEMEKLFEKIYFAINVAFIIIPAIGSKIRTIKREKTLETIVEDIKKIDQSKLGKKLEEELFFTKKERQEVMEALNSPKGDGTDLIKKYIEKVDLPFISSNLISEVTKNIEEGLSELKMNENYIKCW